MTTSTLPALFVIPSFPLQTSFYPSPSSVLPPLATHGGDPQGVPNQAPSPNQIRAKDNNKKLLPIIIIYQPLSHVQLFATPWTECSLPGSSVHGILQARIPEMGCHADPPGPGIKTEAPAAAGGFFTI